MTSAVNLQQSATGTSSSSSTAVGVKRSLQHCSSPVCQLSDADLWRRFHEVGNEMIVTKAGRRMFPVIAVSINGLDPDALYSVCVEFHPADDNRYKYVGGQWVIAAKSQLHDVPVPTYWHPEIPNFGSHWMNNMVSFGKLKLTNKDKLDKSQVSLVTLHLYQPVIRVIRVAGQQERFTVATFTFPETRFMAVTSYQNEDVTSLKVRYNPFAQKVFQDMAKGRSGGGSTSNGGQDDDGDDEPNLSPPAATEQRAPTTTKMMKSASGVPVATSTAMSSYNNRAQPPQVSPPQQSQQQPHRPVPCQPNLQLIDSNMMSAGMGMGHQDFSSFMQPPRYGAFTPVQQPMFDQFGNDSFQFTSMYNNPGVFTNAYHHPANHPTMPQTGGACFANGPMASTLPPTTNAAAAAAAYASYSSSLLSSSLPPIAHSSAAAAAAAAANNAFWPGFNLYPTGPTSTAVPVPSFHPSTLSMLTKNSDIVSSVTSATTATPTTPSGPSSNNNNSNASGGRSGTVSLMRLGTTNNNNNSGNSNTSNTGNNSGSSTTTPVISSLTGRTSDISGSTSGGSASTSVTGVLKASPPESGYCGSPPGEEWTACAYQQLNRPGSTNNNNNATSSSSTNAVIASLTSATTTTTANSTNNNTAY